MTMRKNRSWMTLLLWLPIASLAATQPNTPSKSAMPHSVEIKTFDTGNGCVVRLDDPFHGHVYGGAGESGVIPDMGSIDGSMSVPNGHRACDEDASH